APGIVERLDHVLGTAQERDRHRREAEEERKPFAARRDIADDRRARAHLRKGRSVADLEPQQKGRDLLLDGLLADAQMARDLLIREAASDQVHELELTGRERTATLWLVGVHACLIATACGAFYPYVLLLRDEGRRRGPARFGQRAQSAAYRA